MPAHSSGPVWANQCCGDGCGQIALGATAANGVARPSAATLTPPAETTARLAAARSASHGRDIDRVLQQRPPPRPLS